MSLPLPLFGSPSLRFHERPHPDLVSVCHSDLSEWAGMARAADGPPGSAVRTPRQLLSLDRGFSRCSATDGRPTEDQLAEGVGRYRPATESPARGNLSLRPRALLLDRPPERMGQRHCLPRCGGAATPLPPADSPRRDPFRQPPSASLSRSPHAAGRPGTWM